MCRQLWEFHSLPAGAPSSSHKPSLKAAFYDGAPGSGDSTSRQTGVPASTPLDTEPNPNPSRSSRPRGDGPASSNQQSSERVLSSSDRYAPAIFYYPKYRIGHPENYLFSLSKKIFSGPKYPTNILRNFDNRSIGTHHTSRSSVSVFSSSPSRRRWFCFQNWT